MALPSDEEIVRRVLIGNTDDFGLLVQRHLHLVDSIAFAYTGNRTDAEDVVQETFLKAFQALDTLRKRTRFSAWIGSITRNTSLKLREKRAREQPLTDAHLESQAATPDVQKAELLELLRSHVMRMKPEMREVLLLHYYAGKSLREVAAATETSRAAAAKRLRRARLALSQEILARLDTTAPPAEPDKKRVTRIVGAAIAARAVWHETSAQAAAAHVMGTNLGGFSAMTKTLVCAGFVAALGLGGFVALNDQTTSSPPPARASVAAESFDRTQPPPDRVPQTTTAQLAASAAPSLEAPIETSGPGSMKVVVRNSKGEPAGDATVILEHIPWEKFVYPPARTFKVEKKTDASGVASFSDLPLGHYGILAHRENSIWGDGKELTATPANILLTLQPAVPFNGSIRDSDGNPVSGAAVYPWGAPYIAVVPWSTLATLRAVADDSGEFHRDHYPRLPLQFCLVAPNYAKTVTPIVNLNGNPIDFVLERGGTIRGVVIDNDSKTPLDAVSVGISGGPVPEYATVVSDADGRFELGPVQHGSYEVRVVEPGLTAVESRDINVVDGEATDDIVLAVTLGGVVNGFVTDAENGSPVEGMVVHAFPSNRELPARESNPTDSFGEYAIYGLGESEYEIRYDSMGHYLGSSSNESRRVEVELGGEVNDINFAAHKGVLVAGRVIDGDGQTATDARVRIESTDGTFRSLRSRVEPGGRFEFLVPGSVRELNFRALAPHGSAHLGPYDITTSDTHNVELKATVPRDAAIEGRVVNEAGRPLPFAPVWGLMDSDGSVSVLAGRYEIADYAGKFSMNGLHPDRYWVVAGAENREEAESAGDPIVVGPGETARDVTIVYGSKSKLSIRGRIVDEKGAAIPNARIDASGPRYSSAVSDADGSFDVGWLREGTYMLKATHSEHSTAFVAGVEGGAAGIIIESMSRANLAGRVLSDATGAPVTKFEVLHTNGSARDHDGQIVFERPDGSRFEPDVDAFRRVSDDHGRFEWKGTESGPTIVAVRAQGFTPYIENVTVPPGGSLDSVVARLQPAGAVIGRVVDAAGNPVQGASVEPISSMASLASGEAVRAVTSPDGSFRLEGLAMTVHRIKIAHPDHASTWVEALPQQANASEILVTLSAGGSIEGAVYVDQGADTDVWIEIVPDPPNESGTTMAVADGGRFRSSKLTPGAYIVRAHARGTGESVTRRTFSLDAVVEDNSVTPVNIEFPSGTASLEGTVRADGVPVEGAYLVARVESPNGLYELTTFSTAGGAYRFDNVPVGDIVVAADMAQHPQNETTFTVEPNAVVHADIEL